MMYDAGMGRSYHIVTTLISHQAACWRRCASGDEDAVEAKQKLALIANSARAQIVDVFSACLPSLRAWIANLSMAQGLIDSAQENPNLTLRIESMTIE
ncbi:hypothetical protein P691DRAFT_590223 [Macrolepiota fuliginosa MF-IS2]|uniref:Uncharacterized protein n=1 Tax=Macrolepiota fuliginosa MF-IS2 TaxID=1400762 RepID=A0A9P5XGU2_9AGAR|nr:hypothetical protein P691DRAFT_590223 [Macrolepiota fuliginosa MF-IS2]